MKKLLAILGATGLVVSTGAILVSCSTTPGDFETQEIDFKEAKFTKKVVKESIHVSEVTSSVISQKVTVVKLDPEFELSDDGLTLSGKLIVPKGLPDGTYTVTFGGTEFIEDPKPEDKPETILSSAIKFDIPSTPAPGDDKKELSEILINTELRHNANADGSLPTKGDLGLEVEDGVLIQAVIDTNEGFNMNDGNVKDGSIVLNTETHTGEAIIVGAGIYKGEVKVTFTFAKAKPAIK